MMEMGWFIAMDGSSTSNEATLRELMVKNGSED